MIKKTDSELRKEKKNRDKLSFTIIGVILYSVLLIAVMAGSYVGVKNIFKNHDLAMANKVQEEAVPQDEPKEEAVAEEVNKSEPIKEPASEQKKDHTLDISDVIDSETGCIDYSNIVFKPARRDDSLKWHDTVFSRIEGVDGSNATQVNSYLIKRIDATLSDQKNVEYKAYTNPENGYIEKITEVVNCGDSFEVLNYYYDEGIINYVTQDRMIIEKPVPVSSADIESRYYFDKDVLVRFIFCDGGTATEYSVASLKSYSSGTVEQYDFLEKDMINRAYIVYNLANNLNDTEILYGYVLDEFSMPLEDAQVVITSEVDGKIIAKTETDGDGYYKAIVADDSQATYMVTANKDTLNSVSVYGITAYAGSSKVAVDPIYMNYIQNGAVYNVAIMARDAFDTNKALAGATIKLRNGLNNREGEVFVTGTLDAAGMATVPMYAGSYTAEVSLGGYEVTYFPVIVRIDHQAAVGFAVPDVPNDQYSVVMSWESSPLDLDIKAISANQAKIIKSSVDSIGSTMAEAFVLDNIALEDYRIFVSDYGSISNNDPLAYSLTSSSAQVYVYSSDGQIASMHVPVASAGVVWEPCEIFAGQVLSVNNYFYAIENDPLWNQK